MSLTRKVFNTDKAPEPIGPYSHAIKSGNMVYTSGQVGSHPDTRALVDGGITPETRQALKNLKRILEHAGSSMAEVVKCTVFIADMKEFVDMNRVYAEFTVYFSFSIGPSGPFLCSGCSFTHGCPGRN
ncbi:uncharacterized protein LOC111269850 isoform X2 [Varroa jacobsoni]|uniref:uncharacterized protein LOC111269850 isoform X2 n=1 Tax=Varroa jacobsoni TaxID=62625 RepID=UPI000BF5137E|nr:uncharacterized protein LOC111269850 isoform X2 [Varroa jacobsoni]